MSVLSKFWKRRQNYFTLNGGNGAPQYKEKRVAQLFNYSEKKKNHRWFIIFSYFVPTLHRLEAVLLGSSQFVPLAAAGDNVEKRCSQSNCWQGSQMGQIWKG